jgi:predicted esterase
MSLFTGLTTTHKLAGVFGLSCYLVMGDKVKQLAKDGGDVNTAGKTPFFMGHGDADEVVKYQWGFMTAKKLQEDFSIDVDFRTYKNLPHSAAMEEIDDLEQFVKKCLPEVGEGSKEQ